MFLPYQTVSLSEAVTAASVTSAPAAWIDDELEDDKFASSTSAATKKHSSIFVLDTFAEQYLSDLALDMNVETSIDEPLPLDFSDLLFL